jgi:hypothetical protein
VGSVTSNLTFGLPDGAYDYVALPVGGYTTSSSGSFYVHLANLTIFVNYSPQTWPVIFVAFGLAQGTNWGVTVVNATAGVNQTLNSTTNSIEFFLADGTYTFVVHVPLGYTGNGASTTFTVAGSQTRGPQVTFHPKHTTAASPPPSWGSSNAWWYVAALGIVAAAALVVALVVVRTRRLRTPHPSPREPPRAAPRSSDDIDPPEREW